MRVKSGKHGADVRYLHPAVWGALFIARLLWLEQFPQYEFVITSANEGKHQTGSRHYLGLAADFRTKDPMGKWALSDEERLSFKLEYAKRVGDEFDVTISQPYLNCHVELDAKGPLR